MGKSLVVFTTPTCAPCKALKPILDHYCKDNGIPVRYQNAEEDTLGFDISSVPTVIVFNDLRPVDMVTSPVTISKIREKVES